MSNPNEQNTPVEPVEVDLDDFSKEFFGDDQEPNASKEEEAPQAEDLEESDANETEEDTPEESDDNDDSDDDDLDEPKEEDTPKPKNRFQERINELTAKAREAERRAEEIERRLQEYEKPKAQEAPKADTTNDGGPTPDDKNEDGTDKYPLGEFDPQYIRDLTKHTLAEEQKAIRQQAELEKQRQEEEQIKQAMQEEWQKKLAPAQERYPDFHEKGEQLDTVFENVDPKYTQYLATTIMSMDFGPDVLYYLANNTDEAERIISMGPTKATIALGRLESKFAFADEEKQKARPKISKAPQPPERLNKGSAAAVVEVEDATDDLDAFAKKFFKKRR